MSFTVGQGDWTESRDPHTGQALSTLSSLWMARLILGVTRCDRGALCTMGSFDGLTVRRRLDAFVYEGSRAFGIQGARATAGWVKDMMAGGPSTQWR